MAKLAKRIGLALILVTVTFTPVQAQGWQCEKIFPSNQPTSRVLSASIDVRGKVASLNSLDPSRLIELANDSTSWLDTCGKSYFVDQPAPKSLQSATAVDASSLPYSSTFLLHSKPGSSKTIYLDFDGYYLTGTAWNSSYGGNLTLAPYDQDNSPSTFSSAEQDVIQSVWQRVAEDYSPFDVDVTTEQPSLSAIQRTDLGDNVFGTVLVVTNDSLLYAKVCPNGCGGISYVGKFNQTGSAHDYYQPSLVFTRGVGTMNPKTIAEAASHEVGHMVGLSHDGTSTSNYYAGTQGWAPIMGVGYYQPMVQFSRGEYLDANNQENDFAVMQNTGLALRVDDHGDTTSSATSIALGTSTAGVISAPADTDVFVYTAATTGSVNFRVWVSSVSPNLAPGLRVYVGTALVYTKTPTPLVTSSDVMTELDCTYSYYASAGTKIYLFVDGLGNTSTGLYPFSDYGSVGQYRVTASTSLLNSTATLPNPRVGAAYSASLTATGGVPPYTWTGSGLPAGLALSSSGALTGTPTVATSTVISTTVTDSIGLTSNKNLSLTVDKGVTQTALTTSSTSPVPGSPITLRATLTYQGGTSVGDSVTMYDAGSPIGTVSMISGAGSLTITPVDGLHSYTASFAGNSNWTGSSSSPVTVNVGKATPTIALTAAKTLISPNTANTISATVTNGSAAVSGLSVVFKNGSGTTLATITTNTSGVASFTTSQATSYTITATTPDTVNYATAISNTVAITVASVPAAPTNPLLTQGATGVLSATWGDGASGGQPITSYCIYLYQVGKSSKLLSKTCNVTSKPYVFSGLSRTVTYAFRVSAVNAVGEGALSAQSPSISPL